MTTPSGSGGHFHFSQDIEVALAEIDAAIRGFSGKVSPAVKQLNESLVIGVSSNQAGVEGFLDELRVAVGRAETLAREASASISRALSSGLRPDYSAFEAQATREVERIAQIFQRGLGAGVLRPSDTAAFTQTLQSVSGGLQGQATQAAVAGGGQAPTFEALNARVQELQRAMETAAQSLAPLQAAEDAVAAAARKLADAQANQARVQTEQAERAAAAGEEDRNARRRARSASARAEERVRTAAEELATAEEAAAVARRAQAAQVRAETIRQREREVTPHQLVAESQVREGNPFFRNSSTEGPLTIPLGNGTYGRLDDQGANPRFYKTFPGEVPTLANPLGTDPFTRELKFEDDPARHQALLERLDKARAAAANSATELAAAELRLAKATELETLHREGQAVKDASGRRILDQTTGEGYSLKDSKFAGGRTEATLLGDTDTARLKSDLARQSSTVEEATRAEAELALGAKLAAERLLRSARQPGGADDLGNNFFRLSNGDLVKRQGEAARKLEQGTNEHADAEKRLADLARRRELVDEREGHQAQGFFQGLKGGFTSHGFNSNGDPQQSLTQNLTNIGGTIGVLSRYALAGTAIQGLTDTLQELTEGAIQFSTEVEHLNIFLERLNESLDETAQVHINLAQAQQAGLDTALEINSAINVGTSALAAYQSEVRGGADANDIFTESIKQAGIAALITGQQADDASKQLISITSAFGTGSSGQSEANDAIANSIRNFGGDPKQIASAVAAAAPLASQGGISVEELANMAAIINARTTQSGERIATTIERLVTRSQNKEFLDALQANGIENTGNLTQSLSELSTAYNQLDKPAQIALQTQLGSQRSLTGLLPLLQHFSEVTDANAKSLDHIGAGEEEANLKLASFAGQVTALTATLKTLAVDIGQSGIFAPVGVALELIAPPLRVVTDLLGAMENAIGPLGRGIGGFVVDGVILARVLGLIGGSAGRAAEATAAKAASDTAAARAATANAAATEATVVAERQAAIAAATRVAASQALALAITEESSATAILATETEALALIDGAAARAESAKAVAHEASAAAATEAAAAELALAEATTASSAAAGRRVLGVPIRGLTPARAAGSGAGFLGTSIGGAALLGYAAAGLAIVSVGEKAFKLSQAFHEVDTAIDNITYGSVEDLKGSIGRLESARADIKKESTGLVGGFTNFIAGNPAADRLKEIDEQANELKAQINEIEASSGKLNTNTPTSVFGATGVPSTVNELSQGLSRLKESGAGADATMRTLIGVIDNLTGANQRAATKIEKGALVLPTGTPFADQEVLGALKEGKIDGTKIGALQGIDSREIATIIDRFSKSEGVGTVGDPNDRTQAGNPNVFGVKSLEGLRLSGNNSAKIRQAIEDSLESLGKSGEGSVLSVDDQQAVATAAANAIDLPGDLAALRPALRQLILDRFAESAAHPPTKDEIIADPTRINATVTAAIQTSQSRTSEAQARGAGTDELLRIQSQNLTDLQHFADSINSMNLDKKQFAIQFDALNQGLAVGRKNLVDAYAEQVDAVAEVAENKLAKGDDEGKARIEAQAARVKTLANRADASALADGFTSLAGAEDNLTTAAVNRVNKLVQAARVALSKARADAQVLLAAAAQMDAEARAVFAAVGREDSIAANLTAGADGKRAAAQAGIDAATKAVDDAKKPLALNDPSLQPGIDAQKVGADNSSADALTAAQLAALRFSANVFPGDPLGQAQAQLQSAKADLAAAGSDQQAYYTALKALHEAEEGLAKAILTDQDNSRLLGLDRTNPVLVARDKVVAAQAQLAHDQSAGAPNSLLTTDKIAVGDAQNAAEAAAFSQRLQDAQVNDQLGRTSHAAYIQYLNNEHNRLTAIQHRTRQQQDELNQIDQALQSAVKSLQGQFNLGDIALPSVFQVRQQVAGGVGAQNGVTQNVKIEISGGDIAAIKSVLSTYFGPSAFARNPVTTQKV